MNITNNITSSSEAKIEWWANNTKIISSTVTQVRNEANTLVTEEYVDIIDEKHYLETGKIKSLGKVLKKAAHENWDLHMASHVWIFNSKWEVLLQKRSEDKDSYPWLWDISAAWHVSYWEDFETWAYRELLEELFKGNEKEVDINSILPIFEYRENVQRIMKWKHWHNNEINKVFMMKYDWDISKLSFQVEEVQELKFIPLEQFEQEIFDERQNSKYVPQNEMYYKKVIEELKKALKK